MSSKSLRPLRERPGHGTQLSERVANRVREAIMLGELTSPDYIRTEKLAAELGVSPTPVREALMALSSEGSVKWEPRRGFRVVAVTSQDIRDLFDVQAYAAGELAARAVDNFTDDDIADLTAIQAAIDAAYQADQVGEVVALNHQFHRKINRAARSTRLASLLRNTVSHVPLSSYDEIPGWSQASVDDHAPILSAIAARDREAAKAAMYQHIVHVGEQLIDYLQTQRQSG